jgi:hypothetical protein
MSYIAGIDIHKKMLAVVVSDVEVPHTKYKFTLRLDGLTWQGKIEEALRCGDDRSSRRRQLRWLRLLCGVRGSRRLTPGRHGAGCGRGGRQDLIRARDRHPRR